MGVVGHCNPYETIEYFLKKKVWEWQMDERGKANCRYGNLHERSPKKPSRLHGHLHRYA